MTNQTSYIAIGYCLLRSKYYLMTHYPTEREGREISGIRCHLYAKRIERLENRGFEPLTFYRLALRMNKCKANAIPLHQFPESSKCAKGMLLK